MITKQFVGSDGIPREIDGKKFDKEFRIYRVRGDVTKFDALEELAQMCAIEFKCERVILNR